MRNKFYTTKSFQEALRGAVKLKGGLDRITDPMIITDEDGIILFANEAVAQRAGFTHGELIGKTPGELWGNNKDESFYEYMWQTIKVDKKPFTATNMVNRRRDGTYYGCDVRIYPVLDDDKNIAYFMGIESNYSDSI